MKKGLKVTITVISSLLVAILIFLGVYFYWPWNKDFFNNATQEFEIPGLDTSFCPQGFTKIDGENMYVVSGYMNDGSPSRFYLIDGESNKVIKYVTLSINDVDYTGHAGGVASCGSTLWTVSQEEDGKGYGFRFLLQHLKDAENGDKLTLSNRDYFETYNNADFVFVYDRVLWIGEFYKKDSYETDKSHRLTARSGELNTAIVYGYEINESLNYGLAYNNNSPSYGVPFPSKALSIRGLCQGIAVTSDGKFVMSTSYGLPDSNIYYYKNVLDEDVHNKEFKIGLTQVDLWYLDNESLISETNAPAMAEELIVEDGRVFILFESACKKYKLYNRKKLTNVYSLSLTYLER